MKKVAGILFGTVIAIIVLFGVAGTVAWWNAWVFIVYMMLIGAYTQRLVKKSPGLAEERRTASAKAKQWDLKFVRLINLALPVVLLVAALDIRFRWLPSVPVSASIAALIAMAPAALLTYRAIAVNIFFSSHVRIQAEREHVVVTTGPYRFVRHPGYTGSILFNLLVPVALGSWFALVPGIGTAVLLVCRTVKEDRVLMEELHGYITYSKQVRYRLIPGIF
ncbi:MAG: isoprenylcysteine carboxylmethyltransferase family protein [Desulfobacteraceae bacterium]|jgi:protein-S-isoprenylcysteine O-methyltransferase Ste14